MQYLYFIFAFAWIFLGLLSAYFASKESSKRASIIFSLLCMVTAALLISAGVGL